MKITEFEGCPADSNKFVTGLGLTVFDKKTGNPLHQIEAAVANEHSVDTGCGFAAEKGNDYSCLGAGSLELIIDGRKVTHSIDMPLSNGGTILAYNTIASCSRRWFDFDLTPPEDVVLSRGRNLRNEEEGVGGAFNIIDGMKDTTIDSDTCTEWTTARKENGDLLKRTGTWSTVVIKTEQLTLHVAYKQIQNTEGCNAHVLDMWIQEVSPDVYLENWEGVVGETKDMSYHYTVGDPQQRMSRTEALKYITDEEYEVIAPLTTKCQACADRP